MVEATFDLKEIENAETKASRIDRKSFKLVQKSSLKAHKTKLRSMIIDTTKAVLYSSGDSLLLGIDLTSPTSLHSQIKISNSSPSEL